MLNQRHPVRAYREKAGLSLKALAAVIGVSAATISRIETGLQQPSLPLVQKFVDLTDLKAADFLRQSEEAE